VETTNLIERVVQRSLVQVEEGPESVRYRLLETVRQFAAEQLELSDEVPEFRERHMSWYAGIANAVTRQLQDAREVTLLERDYNNLLSALRNAIDADDEQTALDLGVGLWLYWYVLGQYSEGYAWLTPRSPCPELSLGTPARTRALSLAAHLAYCQGDFPTAQSLLVEAYEIADRVGTLEDWRWRSR
jgi:hypothetical protein